jgi:hypothetical protein
MDPITLVVAALVAGLTAGVTDTAKSAVKDMYESLKARLQKKVEVKADAQQALVNLEKKPDSEARQAVLREELAGLGIEKDADLLALAKALLEKMDEEGAKAGKYNITITAAQGVVIGDQAKVEQRFGTAAKDE